MAEQHVQAVGRVGEQPVEVAAVGCFVVGPPVGGELGDELVGADGATEGAAASAVPGPGAAPVGPPQCPAEVQRPPRRARLGDIGALGVVDQAGPGLVVAVDDDDRHGRTHGQAHQRRPGQRRVALGVCPGPGVPGAVLQPEVADGDHRVAALAFGEGQRGVQDAVVVVDISEHQDPLHGALGDRWIVLPGPRGPPPAAHKRLL